MKYSNKYKKLSIILIFIVLFDFFIPTYSHADVSDALVSPIKGLLLAIGDSFLSIMQGTCLGDYDIVYSKEDQAGLNDVYTNAYGETMGKWVASSAYGLASLTNNLAGGSLFDEAALQDRPHIKYTPFKIFANRIALLDVNFFHPGSGTISYNGVSLDITKKEMEDLYNESIGFVYNSFYEDIDATNYTVQQMLEALAKTMRLTTIMNPNHDSNFINNTQTPVVNATFDAFQYLSHKYPDDNDVNKKLTTEDIEHIKNLDGFTTAIIIFNSTAKKAKSADTEMTSSAAILQKVIAKWYITLRNIGLVAMLSILVYIGIRIIITSSSNEKAKYKQMFTDWLVAVFLLFFMHYIMAFSIQIIEKITDLVSTTSNDDFFNTCRLLASSEYSFLGLGYTILYLILVFFTLYFTFIYLRRVLYMAFLTLIAPLVAVTYPIDKLNDGKAQAYDTWLKEYLFNLLIQPLHLLLYFILISSAADLANKYIIYSFVALAFMIPAEKLLRRFFGFEKAQTPGLLAGPAGGALMMNAMRSLGHFAHGPRGPHGKPGSANNSGKSSEVEDGNESKKPFFSSNMNAMETLNEAFPASNESEGQPTLDNGQENANALDENTENPRVSYDHSDKENGYTEEEYQNILKGSGWNRDESREQLLGNGWDEAEANQLLTDVYGAENATPSPSSTSPTPSSTTSSTSTGGSSPTSTSSPASTSSNTSSTTVKPKRRRLKGVGNVAKLGGKAIANRAGKVAKFTGKKATQLAAGALIGGTLGAVGLAAGLASGDPGKVLQYASLGGTTGYNLGKSTRDRIAGSFNYEGVTKPRNHTIRDAYRKGSLSKEEYLAKQQQEYIDRYVKEHKEAFAEKNNITKGQAEKALKEVAPDCIRNGIDDIDDINNIYDIKQKRKEWQRQKDAGEDVSDTPPITQEIAMAATKLRNDYNINPSGMTKKTRKELNETGITDEMINVIKQVNTNKKKLG